jgi:hypothetical protein
MEPIKPGFGILERIKQTVIIPIREVTIEEILEWLTDTKKLKKS